MTMSLKSAGLAALSFAVSAGLFVFALAPASAATLKNPDAVSKVVSTADLQLTSSAGRHTLDTRLRAAARAVCAPLSMGRASIQEHRCREAALASTRKRVEELVAESRSLAAEGFQPRIAATIVVSAQ